MATQASNVTFRLMNESVQGPRETVSIEVPDPSDVSDVQTQAEAQALAWARGQIGHPWDVLTVEFCDEDFRDLDFQVDLPCPACP